MNYDIRHIKMTFKVCASFGNFEKQRKILARSENSVILKARKWLLSEIRDNPSVAIISGKRINKTLCVTEGFPNSSDMKLQCTDNHPLQTKQPKSKPQQPQQGLLL